MTQSLPKAGQHCCESNTTASVAAWHGRRCEVSLKALLPILAFLIHAVEVSALAQQPTRAEELIPAPEPKHFAFTLNPLNVLIGRYAFNFEYQPIPHHGLIVTPHYDYLSGSGGSDCDGCTDTLSGAGAEFGYRFYSGKSGFDGFFVGPSLLIASHTLTTTYEGVSSIASASVGGALDSGWQWQLGNFIIGGGAGVQYTAFFNQRLRLPENGIGLRANLNAGSGYFLGQRNVQPRLLLNVGYAF